MSRKGFQQRMFFLVSNVLSHVYHLLMVTNVGVNEADPQIALELQYCDFNARISQSLSNSSKVAHKTFVTENRNIDSHN